MGGKITQNAGISKTQAAVKPGAAKKTFKADSNKALFLPDETKPGSASSAKQTLTSAKEHAAARAAVLQERIGKPGRDGLVLEKVSQDGDKLIKTFKGGKVVVETYKDNGKIAEKATTEERDGKKIEVRKTYDDDNNVTSKTVKENDKITFQSDKLYENMIDTQVAVYSGENTSDSVVKFAEAKVFTQDDVEQKMASYADAAENMAKQQIAKWDVEDGNKGKMSFGEFQDEQDDFRKRTYGKLAMGRDDLEAMAKLESENFDAMDINQDGFLDSKELATSIMALDASKIDSSKTPSGRSLNNSEYEFDGKIDFNNTILYQNLGDELKKIHAEFFGDEKG